MPKKTGTPAKPAAGKQVLTGKQAIQIVQNVSAMLSRSMMAQGLGQSFDGKRDFYQVFGYPTELTPQMLWNMYDRDGMAAIATDGIADECWRLPPYLYDGDVKGDRGKAADMTKQTEFLKTWKVLDEKLHIFATLQQADRILGYSRYALIFLGAPGDYSKPLEQGTVEYLMVFDELDATWSAKVSDVNDPRFGLPEAWNITFADEARAQPVHWSRVIHIREGIERRSRIYGVPRMRKIYNYLLDLQKVLGGSSEAFWLLVNRGMAILGKDGVDMPQKDTPEYKNMQDEIDEYQHQLRRILRLRGVEIQELGGQVVSGDGQVGVLLQSIAGSIKTPQRILTGSEMGQLASSQDDKNFADTCKTRQTNFCDPFMLRPVVDAFIKIGALPTPTKPPYTSEYPSLFELNPLEKGQLSQTKANTINTITGGAPETAINLEDFMREEFNYVMPDELVELQEDKLDATSEAVNNPPENNAPTEGKKVGVPAKDGAPTKQNAPA